MARFFSLLRLRLALSDDESWFSTVVKAINEIFSLELDEYENLPLGQNDAAQIRMIVVALFIGIFIACCLSIFNRRVLGEFVRSLIEENCSDTASAKTLYELGYMKNTAVRAAIKGGNTYRGVLRCVEQDEYNTAVEQRRGEYNARAAASGEKMPPFKPVEYKIDFEKAHFYIPEEVQYPATVRFEKRGTNWPALVLMTVIGIVLLWVLLKVLPSLIGIVDGLAGSLDNSPNIN